MVARISLTFDRVFRQMREQRRKVMDAKYNFIIDSWKWRIALNVAGFAVWLTAVVGLIKLAA